MKKKLHEETFARAENFAGNFLNERTFLHKVNVFLCSSWVYLIFGIILHTNKLFHKVEN